MGYGAVHDLVTQPDVEEITVADVAAERAHHVASSVEGNVTPRAIDVSNHEDVVALMRGHDSAISCVNYWLNERLARAAIPPCLDRAAAVKTAASNRSPISGSDIRSGRNLVISRR